MALTLNGDNTASTPGYAGSDSDTGLQPGTNELDLVTGGTSRVKIDSSGRVGIGNSSPSEAKLCVNGGISVEGTYSSQKANIFTVDNLSGATRLNSFGSNTSTPGSFVFFGYSSDASAGGERMRILSSGGLTFNGDTAAANALDDYEEGTWTPTYVSSGASFTYSSNTSGSYVKIGRLVFCRASLRTDSISGGTAGNQLRIGGLPFTVNNNNSTESGYSGVHIFLSYAFGGDHPISGQTSPNSTETFMYYRDAVDGETKGMNYGDLVDGSSKNFIKFNVIYEV